MVSRSYTQKSSAAAKLLSAILIGALLLPGGAVFAAGEPLPLSAVPVPVPRTNAELAQAQFSTLAQYVKDVPAAVKLGKALFWDMQTGSDGVQACATCHYRAGADPIDVRSRNQLNPGHNGVFDVKPGPNSILTLLEFPFFQVTPVDAQIGTGTITNDKDDVAGSQGVLRKTFTGINSGSALDSGTTNFALPFNNHRQVTGRNTPPAVNAVFNYANFWDGRANNIFNGSSPIGPLDVNAGIWIDNGSALVKQSVSIPNASLASQAVGPPLSDVEMSWAGRTFPELGRKMLSLTPLAQQTVHPEDSVLGPLSLTALKADGTLDGAKGLNTSYNQMIMDAFVDTLWNSGKTVSLSTVNGSVSFNQMEANFSLFWGLAIQLYEATLVSDQTPFDRYLDDVSKGIIISTAMSVTAQNGFGTFSSQCAKCHSGSELTGASVSNAVAAISSTGSLIETGATGVNGSVSDIGFSNVGVQPSSDDLGRGGVINFPLSFAAQAISKLTNSSSIPFATFPLVSGATVSSPVAVNGAFKIPSIRNVELTAPYWHNGGALTLEEVVEFYARGGNFANLEMDAEMKPIGTLGGADKRAEVVEFLKALTDERVRNESAPFDHPELLLPQGDPELPMTRLHATGFNGQSDNLPAFTMTVTSPTNTSHQTITGTLEQIGANIMAAPKISVNSVATGTATASGNTWSFNVTGLVQGENTITATATDLTGVTKTINKTILVGITGPVGSLVINADDAVTHSPFVTLNLSASGPSAVTAMSLSTDGLIFAPYETYSAVRLFTLPAGDGEKGIYVKFRDTASRESTVYFDSIVLDTTTPPSPSTLPVTINVMTPTNVNYQTVSGAVAAGSTVKVTVDTPAVVGPVTVDGTSWSARITKLREGPNSVTAHASDANGVVSTASAIIIVDTKEPFINVDSAIAACIREDSIQIAGTAELGSKIKVICDYAKADVVFFDDFVDNRNRWIATILGLVEKLNHCEIFAIDAAGNKAEEKVDFDHDSIKPVIVIDPNVKKVARNGVVQTVSGTVEAGATVTMKLNGAPYNGAITVNGANWTCPVDDLKVGKNIIEVIAVDACKNVDIEDINIDVIVADGDLDGILGVNANDALKALRIAVGLDIADDLLLFHGDLFGDNIIDVGDAVLILKKAVGLFDGVLGFDYLYQHLLSSQRR